MIVIALAVVFYFADIPDIKTRDEYHLDDAPPGASRSIWPHPHFVMAVAAQFFPVPGRQRWEGSPPILASCRLALRMVRDRRERCAHPEQQRASNLASLGFVCFLAGRFSGAGLLARFAARFLQAGLAVGSLRVP